MPFTNILLANWYAAVCGSILMFKTVKTHQTVKTPSPTLFELPTIPETGGSGSHDAVKATKFELGPQAS
jgi:hypothetical protein